MPGVLTLIVALHFYALFAATLLLPRHLQTMTALLLALACAGLLLHPSEGTALAAYTSPLLLEFLAGMWLHHAWRRGWLATAWPALPLGCALLLMQVQLPAAFAGRALGWGVPAALIVAGAISLEGKATILARTGLRQLGDTSYSLYLTHVLVQQYLLPVLHPLPAVIAVPTALAVCVAVGTLVHRGVEHPMTRWLGRAGHRRWYCQSRL